MAPNTVALIRQVDKIRNDYQLKVRIIRLWKLPVFNNPTETFGIEMILMDEEGNKMQASVFKKCVVHFEKILAERACFFVDCPLVAANDSKYRYLDGPYKLIFGDRTRLRRCVDFSGPLYGFSFVSFASILKTATSAHEVVDVIAHVTKIYELEKVPVKGNKTTERLNLDVQDSEKRQVRMTLWGDFATQLVNYVSANIDKGILIIILQFGKVNYYRDLPYFSNLFGISRLIINGDLPEVAQYAQRLQHENDGSDIPRLSLTPSDTKIPFKFQRRQFPIAVSFAMTVNKSQGQSLSKVGLYLKHPVFSHGQLYVALSRVTNRNGLKLLVMDADGNLTNKTSNVVYKEVLRGL